MGLFPPKEAAAEIVKAQRRNIGEFSIPSHWLGVNYFLRFALNLKLLSKKKSIKKLM